MITLLIKDIKTILSNELSLSQRGLLITILLCKDNNKDFEWAKIKSQIKFENGIKRDLIYLHDKEFLQYGDYNKAKKYLSQVEINPNVIEVIDYMNKLYGRRFDYKSESTTKFLKDRLKDFSLDEIKDVVSNRFIRWSDDNVMKQHLNPVTIFRKSKFPIYLEDVKSTKVGKSYRILDDLNMEDGDEFKYDIIDSIVDSEVYGLNTLSLDEKGEVVGIGKFEKIYGKDLKILLKVQNNEIKLGNKKKFSYIYKK